MAEALLDPTEIWLGVTAKENAMDRLVTEFFLDRRFIRLSADGSFLIFLQIGRTWWDAVTAYPVGSGTSDADIRLLNIRRGGKLIWKRKDGKG